MIRSARFALLSSLALAVSVGPAIASPRDDDAGTLNTSTTVVVPIVAPSPPQIDSSRHRLNRAQRRAFARRGAR